MTTPPMLILSVALSAEDAKALSEYVVAEAEAAVRAEREKCAKIVEDFDPGCSYRIRRVLAAAIRARGES